jgi:DNA invertase Pin-like site-specific DNA recombinase
VQGKARDVVVVGVSEQGSRAEENFHSPKAQLAKARLWGEDQGNCVVDAFEEIDVSGKLRLARRPGLLTAIEMVEAGAADHIVVAYFDRLVRSLKVQLEVIARVEQAGGEIYAIDHGRLTNGTAATRMSNNMMGAAFHCYADVTGEKVAAARERVVARGVLPNSRISPGFVRGEDGVVVEIRGWLARNGIERSISGVESMLRSRTYLGEIHFGELHNPRAHEPIIKDRRLFERVQRRTVSRGRQAKSERLLARLGVLRCGSCGSRMVINSYTGRYRCGDTSANRCPRRAAVNADRVEVMLLDAVRAYSATAGGHGRALTQAADPRGGRGDRTRQRGSR